MVYIELSSGTSQPSIHKIHRPKQPSRLTPNSTERGIKNIYQTPGWFRTEVVRTLTKNEMEFDQVYSLFPSKLHYRFLERHFHVPKVFQIYRFNTLKALQSIRNSRELNFRRIQKDFKVGTGGAVINQTGGRTPQYQDEFFRSCWEGGALTFKKSHPTSEFTLRPAGLKGWEGEN